jgi:hypothetical protein
MAHEENREDLLAEATALVERIELRIAGRDEPLVAGFRRDGSASFFFGAERVYQFNSQLQLRRAFVDALLYKAERGLLVQLERRRGASQTLLLRRELSVQEQQNFLSAAEQRLLELRTAIEAAQFQIVGQHPANADVVGRVLAWLSQISFPLAVASSPRVK